MQHSIHCSLATLAATMFVVPERIQGTMILAGPAGATSATAVRELAELHAIEASRTPEQVARAMDSRLPASAHAD